MVGKECYGQNRSGGKGRRPWWWMARGLQAGGRRRWRGGQAERKARWWRGWRTVATGRSDTDARTGVALTWAWEERDWRQETVGGMDGRAEWERITMFGSALCLCGWNWEGIASVQRPIDTATMDCSRSELCRGRANEGFNGAGTVSVSHEAEMCECDWRCRPGSRTGRERWWWCLQRGPRGDRTDSAGR